MEDFEDENVFSKDELIHHASSEDDIASAIQPIAGKFTVLSESLHSGFIMNDPTLLIYNLASDIERYFKRIRKRKQRFKGITFSELKSFSMATMSFTVTSASGLFRIKEDHCRQQSAGSCSAFLSLK
ncbi:MAG: hypothetical protein IPL67_17775 [Ignavibacteria bacterium]|nr:hypothetical protein [Ignavibacteria bacterium]